MTVTMEAGCGMTKILKAVFEIKNNLPGAGFAHFDRRDVG